MNVIFRRDDIALVIGMFCILAVTVAVVVLKVKCTRNGIHMKPQEKTLTPNILYYAQIKPNQFRQCTIFDRIRTVIWTSSSETKMTSETENLSKSIDPRLISFFQVNFIDPEPLNVSTFAPLPQAVSIFIIIGVMVQRNIPFDISHLQVNDDKKYVDFGYIPCNGHVPCQPAHLSPENVN